MENCMYEGKEICTFHLKDKNGYYINDLVLEWKIAASAGHLICSECGQRVYLAAGPIKEPYFAHLDKQTCSYGNQKESEELKKGKRLLYSLLKQSFPENDIRARYRLQNGMYSTCYVINPAGKDIAIDYRRQYSSVEDFYIRNTYYKENNIIPLYVLGINKNCSEQISWYDDLIQKSIGYCIYLDSINEKFLLKKHFVFTLGNQRKIRICERLYTYEDIKINKEGTLLCDFEENCKKTELSIQEILNAHSHNHQRLNYSMNNSNKLNQVRLNEIRPDILRSALRMIKRGEGHLVSEKYMDYIKKNKLFQDDDLQR